MQASTPGSAPTDTALLISQEGVTFGQFEHGIICHGEISIHKKEEKKESIWNWQFWRGLQSPIPAWATGTLCWTGVMSPARAKADLFTAVSLEFSANHPQLGVISLSTAPSSLLAMTFHSTPWLDAVHEHQVSDVIEGSMFSCTLLSCGKTISPWSVNFMQNPQMTDTTEPKVCTFFRNPSKISYGY